MMFITNVVALCFVPFFVHPFLPFFLHLVVVDVSVVYWCVVDMSVPDDFVLSSCSPLALVSSCLSLSLFLSVLLSPCLSSVKLVRENAHRIRRRMLGYSILVPIKLRAVELNSFGRSPSEGVMFFCAVPYLILLIHTMCSYCSLRPCFCHSWGSPLRYPWQWAAGAYPKGSFSCK